MSDTPYTCQCKGHFVGSRTFLAAPPEWFAKKGFNTPKRCPACRDWIKRQHDETINCSKCGSLRVVRARQKIWYHLKKGVYELPEECRRCEKGLPPVRGSLVLHRRSHRVTRRLTRSTITSILEVLPPDARVEFFRIPIFASADSYQDLVPNRNGGLEPRHAHIAHHFENSPYSATTDAKAKALRVPKRSPSAFSPPSGRFEDLFPIMFEAWSRAYSEGRIRDYRIEGTDRIARVTVLQELDKEDSEVIEITILQLDRSAEAFLVVTTFDKNTQEYLQKQFKNKKERWLPG